MSKFLIEVPHEAEQHACLLAVQVLLSTGSHYLTHADFGCFDGVHKGWLTVEAENKEEARSVLPPVYRAQSTIVRLNKFTLEEINTLLQQHKG